MKAEKKKMKNKLLLFGSGFIGLLIVCAAVTTMMNMFANCSALETKPQMIIPKDAETLGMFGGTKWN